MIDIYVDMYSQKFTFGGGSGIMNHESYLQNI